jgi:hypothetical protein
LTISSSSQLKVNALGSAARARVREMDEADLFIEHHGPELLNTRRNAAMIAGCGRRIAGSV